MLWIDKHSPKNFCDLTSHKEVNELLVKLVEKSHGEIPHLLFYGPSGAGKRTRILATLRAVFGQSVDKVKPEIISNKDTNSEILVSQSDNHVAVPCPELGSRDRVIVQDIIRNLCSAPSAAAYFTKGPSYRVFVFEDAEALTHAAQAALRRTMETFIKNARMFLHVKQLSRIIAPLRSRCLCIRVASHTTAEVVDALRNICDLECISPAQATNAMLCNIAESSNCNLRRAILTLETVITGGFTLETKNLLLPWERNVARITKTILNNQTPSALCQLRQDLYELLVVCIPGEIILETLAKHLCQKVSKRHVPQIIHLAAHFSHTLKLGTRDIWHLEAFIAHVMSLLSR